MRFTAETLRQLCVDHGWFTMGTNEQYKKLFIANDMGASIDELSAMIWMCTDIDALGTNRQEIRITLEENTDGTYRW